MRRRFRPSLGRLEPKNNAKADIGGGEASSGNESTTSSQPTRRARIKPKVGIICINRNAGPLQRKTQPNQVQKPELKMPAITVTLDKQRDGSSPIAVGSHVREASLVEKNTSSKGESSVLNNNDKESTDILTSNLQQKDTGSFSGENRVNDISSVLEKSANTQRSVANMLNNNTDSASILTCDTQQKDTSALCEANHMDDTSSVLEKSANTSQNAMKMTASKEQTITTLSGSNQLAILDVGPSSNVANDIDKPVQNGLSSQNAGDAQGQMLNKQARLEIELLNTNTNKVTEGNVENSSETTQSEQTHERLEAALASPGELTSCTESLPLITEGLACVPVLMDNSGVINSPSVTTSQAPADFSLQEFDKIHTFNDLIQHLLQDSSEVSLAADTTETLLHTDTACISEANTTTQLETTQHSNSFNNPMINNDMTQNQNQILNQNDPNIVTNQTSAPTRLNTKRRYKPRKPRQPKDTSSNISSFLEYDVSEIPIASNVIIVDNSEEAQSEEIDHPILELPTDLIENEEPTDTPKQTKNARSLKQRFKQKHSGAVKLVVSRKMPERSKELEQETNKDDDQKTKEAVKQKPNVSQPRKQNGSQDQISEKESTGNRDESSVELQEKGMPSTHALSEGGIAELDTSLPSTVEADCDYIVTIQTKSASPHEQGANEASNEDMASASTTNEVTATENVSSDKACVNVDSTGDDQPVSLRKRRAGPRNLDQNRKKQVTDATDDNSSLAVESSSSLGSSVELVKPQNTATQSVVAPAEVTSEVDHEGGGEKANSSDNVNTSTKDVPVISKRRRVGGPNLAISRKRKTNVVQTTEGGDMPNNESTRAAEGTEVLNEQVGVPELQKDSSNSDIVSTMENSEGRNENVDKETDNSLKEKKAPAPTQKRKIAPNLTNLRRRNKKASDSDKDGEEEDTRVPPQDTSGTTADKNIPEGACTVTVVNSSAAALDGIATGTSSHLEDISLSIPQETAGEFLTNFEQILSSAIERPNSSDILAMGDGSFSGEPDGSRVVTSAGADGEMVACVTSGTADDGVKGSEERKEPRKRGRPKGKKNSKTSSKDDSGQGLTSGDTTEGVDKNQGVAEGSGGAETGETSTGRGAKRRGVGPKIPAKRARKKNRETGDTATDDTAGQDMADGAQDDLAQPEEGGQKTTGQTKKRGGKKNTTNNQANDGEGSKTKGKRQTRTNKNYETLSIPQMRMSDLVYYNPTTNPMKEAVSETSSMIHNSSAQDEEIIPAGEQVNEAVATGDDTPPSGVVAPQVTIDAAGNIVLDEESLMIRAATPTENLEDREVVFENTNQQFKSGSKKKYMDRWKKEETLYFYDVLSQVGTDFSLMAKLFQNRDRNDLKKKFKREEKYNRDLIEKALSQRNPISAALFEGCLEETEKEIERSFEVHSEENTVENMG